MEVVLNCLTHSEKSDITDLVDTVEVLVRQGLTPLSQTNISMLDVYATDKESQAARLSVDMTVWQHLLLTCYCCKTWGTFVAQPRVGYAVGRERRQLLLRSDLGFTKPYG